MVALRRTAPRAAVTLGGMLASVPAALKTGQTQVASTSSSDQSSLPCDRQLRSKASRACLPSGAAGEGDCASALSTGSDLTAFAKRSELRRGRQLS
jgi:hypothetical protein